MPNSFGAIIIGAGIVGSAIAREFARAGLKIAIVEGGAPAGATTSAGMGHVVVMDDSPAQLALTHYSRELWRADREHLPAEAEFQTCGTIWVAASNEEMDEVHSKYELYRQHRLVASVLSTGELASLEPNLRTGLAGGLLVPDDGVIRPPAASRFFFDEAQRHGANFIHQRAISARESQVMLADGDTLHADRIVLATGTDCHLLPALPIRKRKGHLVMTAPKSGFLRHQLVELGYLQSAHKLTSDSVAFNVQPRLSGQVVIGSSRQYGVESETVDKPILHSMMERAASFMPGIATMDIEKVWTGFRAAAPDKLPLLGPATGLSNDPSLWLAVGFEGLGTTNAPGAARLLLDQVLGRKTEIDPTPFLPSRLPAFARASGAPEP